MKFFRSPVWLVIALVLIALAVWMNFNDEPFPDERSPVQEPASQGATK